MAVAPSAEPVVAQFTAKVQATKNRHVAIPVEVRQRAGISAADNDLIHVSLRPAGGGYWNHHYFKVTRSGCLAIPTDVSIAGGDRVEVKVHRVIKDRAAQDESAAGVLLHLAAMPRPAWDGGPSSADHDEYLNSLVRG